MGSLWSSSSTSRTDRTISLESKIIVGDPNEFKLHIHFRSIKLDRDGSRPLKSAGHFYLSLQGDPEGKLGGKSKLIYIGKYGKNGIVGPAVIDSKKEAERHACVKELENKDGKRYTLDKTIIITKEQYNEAIDHIMTNKAGLYILWSKNCVDFVQKVYNAMGLPLYFTFLYTFREFRVLNSMAAEYALSNYKCMDEFIDEFTEMHASSKEELVKKLNVDIECILQISNGKFFINIDQPLQRIQEQQPSIDSKCIHNTRIDNLVSVITSYKKEHRKKSSAKPKRVSEMQHYDELRESVLEAGETVVVYSSKRKHKVFFRKEGKSGLIIHMCKKDDIIC